jgi:hypothetical protein
VDGGTAGCCGLAARSEVGGRAAPAVEFGALARRKGGDAHVTAGNPGDLSAGTFAKRALVSS